MFRSLRFRLPALFLAGVVLAGIVSTAIAFRLLQSYSRSESFKELKRESVGLTELYAEQAIKSASEGREGPSFSAAQLERGGPTFGALIVAKPKTELRSTWLTLMKFFGVAFLGVLIVSGGLAWFLGRWITRPVLGLSSAADQIAGGQYEVAVPEVPGGGEIGHLADRFSQMARRLREAEELERNFLMSVSHELRTPLTAIRGHVEALREGLVEDPELRAESLDVIAA